MEESELYRKLVDASTDGLWLLDGEGRTMLCNPRMAELLGRTHEQMEGLSAYDVHDPAGKKQFGAHMERARAGDPGHDDLETMYLRLDGTPIWLLGSFRPIHDDHGVAIGYLHRFSDYTDLRSLIDALKQREQQLASAQAIAKIGSWEWDVVEDHTSWSEELFRIYGIDPARFRGDYESFLALIRAIRAEEAPGSRVPIIAVTTSDLEGERERCLESGMDDFLTKPVDSARLHRVLRQWINGSAGGDAPVSTASAVPPAAPAERGEIVDVSRIEMLHEMVKEGISLFQRSSGNFIAHAQDHLTAIGAAVERGDAEELMATAHKLKGSALNLGLPRVGAAAYELEERGREGMLDGATASFAALSREIGLAVAALEQERAARA